MKTLDNTGFSNYEKKKQPQENGGKTGAKLGTKCAKTLGPVEVVGTGTKKTQKNGKNAKKTPKPLGPLRLRATEQKTEQKTRSNQNREKNEKKKPLTAENPRHYWLFWSVHSAFSALRAGKWSKKWRSSLIYATF